jgi:hypothetical protein
MKAIQRKQGEGEGRGEEEGRREGQYNASRDIPDDDVLEDVVVRVSHRTRARMAEKVLPHFGLLPSLHTHTDGLPADGQWLGQILLVWKP